MVIYASAYFCEGEATYVDDLPTEVAAHLRCTWGEVAEAEADECDRSRAAVFMLAVTGASVVTAACRLIHMAVGGVTSWSAPTAGGRFTASFSSEARARAATELGGWTLRLADRVGEAREIVLMRGPNAGGEGSSSRPRQDALPGWQRTPDAADPEAGGGGAATRAGVKRRPQTLGGPEAGGSDDAWRGEPSGGGATSPERARSLSAPPVAWRVAACVAAVLPGGGGAAAVGSSPVDTSGADITCRVAHRAALTYYVGLRLAQA